MADRTYLPFWKVSIAAHVMGPGHCEDYLDAEIGRARCERVRRRLVALRMRMAEASLPAGEGTGARKGDVISLTDRRS